MQNFLFLSFYPVNILKKGKNMIKAISASAAPSINFKGNVEVVNKGEAAESIYKIEQDSNPNIAKTTAVLLNDYTDTLQKITKNGNDYEVKFRYNHTSDDRGELRLEIKDKKAYEFMPKVTVVKKDFRGNSWVRELPEGIKDFFDDAIGKTRKELNISTSEAEKNARINEIFDMLA